MALQFAKDEKVIQSFNYANVNYNKKKGQYDTFKNLIITNKRIIHESVSDKTGNEIVLRQEMPVSDAKYIKTTMGKVSNPSYLLQAILFAVIAVAAIVLSTMEFAEKLFVLFLVLAAPFVVLTLVKLAAYFASRAKIVSFSIYTDHVVTPVICTAAVEANTDDTQNKKSKGEPTIEIQVNTEIARKIANELGAAILDAVNYKEATEEAIPSYAAVETEALSVDNETQETEEE